MMHETSNSAGRQPQAKLRDGSLRNSKSYATIHNSILRLIVAIIVSTTTAAFAASNRPQSWERKGPIESPPKRTTDAYPLSDQANKAGWVKYAPMSDEFEGKELDSEKWWPRNPRWLGRQPGWFDPDNVRVAQGKLHLTMRKDEPIGMSKNKGYHTYTSAAVQSKRPTRYGYFEVRCKPMPSAGSSSFWFYNNTRSLWTEIDVFEIGGKSPGFEKKYNMNVHVFRTPAENKHWSKHGEWYAPSNLADDYHTYALEWDAEKIKWYFDGVLVRWVENTHWHQSLTLNFDSETMPDWFGLPKDEDLPSTYSIEYVRSWKRTAADCLGLFADTRFQQGFLLSHPSPSKGRAVEAVLKTGDNDASPLWRLCQWATKHSLADVTPTRNNMGGITWKNKAKSLTVGPPKPSGPDLILEIKGETEYGQSARKPGQSWPHLLVEQDAPKIRTLDTLNTIDLRMAFKLLHCKNNMRPSDYNPNLHAAQFQLFLIVKNVEEKSKDFGDFFWFGVPLFDNRHEIPPAFVAKDSGKKDATGKLIYTIDGTIVNNTGPPVKRSRIVVSENLLPHIKSGLKEAVAKGYLSDSAIEHYAVANMNLGWEIPGNFNASIAVSNFSICARPKIK